MRTRSTAGLLCVVLAVMLASCGAKDKVTLGEYNGIDITLNGDYKVSDEAVDDYIKGFIDYYGLYGRSDETVVAKDSIVNVDYTGYQDNQPFDGGSAQNQNIDVDGPGYIDGFTDALIGHKVGETFRENVTFPEDYDAQNLAGETVQFEYTINYICRPIETSELTDEMVSEKFQMGSVDELRKEVRSILTSEREAALKNDTRTAVMDKMLDICEVEIPAKDLDARIDENIELYKKNNLSGGETLEDYLEKYYGMTYDEFYEKQKESAVNDLSLELICRAIAEKEGIEASEADYQAYISDIVANTGQFDSADALYKAYRSSTDAGEQYFRSMFLCNNVIRFVEDNANVIVE